MVRLALALEGLDTEQVYVNGASQGAGLGLVCTALNAAYIKRCAALYPFLSDYRRAWEMDRDVIVYNGLAYHTRWFDPMGEHLDEFFTKLGYIDVQNFVERITCPVLCGTGLMDDVCPPSTQFAVFSKITARKKAFDFSMNMVMKKLLRLIIRLLTFLVIRRMGYAWNRFKIRGIKYVYRGLSCSKGFCEALEAGEGTDWGFGFICLYG